MDPIIIRPFMGLSGEYSVILVSNSGQMQSIEVIAKDEFDAVMLAIEETKWNAHGLITVDTQETIEKGLEPVLEFEYEPI